MADDDTKQDVTGIESASRGREGIFKINVIDIESERHIAIMNQFDMLEMGLRPQERVKITLGENSIKAVVEKTGSLAEPGEIGLCKMCLDDLHGSVDDEVSVIPSEKPVSVEFIKKKLMGKELSKDDIYAIVKDIVDGNLSDIELSAYVSGVYVNGMSMRETVDLTNSMVATGDVLQFESGPIYDFHSVGGAPGNKITLMVVPMAAAAGLLIPKTSSRAISSACGTADIMEVLCPVNLSGAQIVSATERIGGVIAWGGGVNIAPADDLIIRAEYPLSIDPHSQLLASVMAKKKAVGSERVAIDIPMGPYTKVPDEKTAKSYANDFIKLGEMLDMTVECAITYGGQPIGRAVGPAAEAREALAALEGKRSPNSLIDKALGMTSILLSMDERPHPRSTAKEMLESGKALEKFRDIIAVQGGDADIKSEDIELGKYSVEVLATKDGYVKSINNRSIVKMVRAAGAPRDHGAALILEVKEGDSVDPGEVLFTLYAENERKLKDAVDLSRRLKHIRVEGMIIECIPPIHLVGERK